ncbi:AfaD family invasin [Enterobacter roggenkampii]|uniref:AfaD family invasin n=1 Tax=Enterobacter roggenkampii TaxID=1812935 RepID=UPI002A7EC49E|nr:AfaD family invasin [Enterobacter roggenkampii]
METIVIKNFSLRWFVAAVLSFLPFMSVASDSCRIDFYSKRFLTSGPIVDGTLLGHGRAVCNTPHDGFVLWLDEGGLKPGGLIFTPNEPSGSKRFIRVRIDTDLRAAKEDAVHGLRVITSENIVNFRILADGHQEVGPGMWHFTMSAAPILNNKNI